MKTKWKIFIGLVVASGIFVGFSFLTENEFIDITVYSLILFPAVMFRMIGLPTISPTVIWFAIPSVLGLVLDVIFYLIFFYILSSAIVWLKDHWSKKILITLVVVILLIAGYFILNELNDPRGIFYSSI
jgi:hypothetical protein